MTCPYKEDSKKPKAEKEIFQKAPKSCAKAKAKPKKSEEKEEGVFDATKGKVKEGGLRRALKVGKDYRFRKTVVQRLLKHSVGDKFTFEGTTFVMNDKLRKQLQLALNYMA